MNTIAKQASLGLVLDVITEHQDFLLRFPQYIRVPQESRFLRRLALVHGELLLQDFL